MNQSGRGTAVSIRTVLASVLQHAQAQHAPLEQIQRQWRALVGRVLAAHTRPVSLRRGRLVVHADHPGDSFMLSYQRVTLLQHLQTMSNARVEEIVIRPGLLTKPVKRSRRTVRTSQTLRPAYRQAGRARRPRRGPATGRTHHDAISG